MFSVYVKIGKFNYTDKSLRLKINLNSLWLNKEISIFCKKNYIRN